MEVDVLRPNVAFPIFSLEAFCSALIGELTDEENSYIQVNLEAQQAMGR
jgi:hypothetical protein